MGSEDWEDVTFGDVTENLDTIRRPVKGADRKPGPYPYYGASGVVDHVDDYLFERLHLLIAEDGENLRTRKLPVAFLADGRFWVNNHAHIVRGNDRADTRFLSYLMSNTDISGYLSGSTMPKLTQGSLNRIRLKVPPLPEQRAIAEVLGSLDDKIELNRRMNRTLESMARAWFKSWFVDFDPVHANAAGEPTLPPDLAAHFPANFEPSALGEIPEGWKVGTLGDILQPEIGGQWGADSLEDGLVEAVCLRGCDMEDLRSSGWSHRAPARYIKANALQKRQLRDSDLLIAASGAGPCGRPLWASPALQEMHPAPVIYSNFVKRFSTPSRSHAIYFDRFFHEKFLDRSICDFITGTSVPNLDAKGMLVGLDVLVPTPNVLGAYAALCEPIFDRLYSPENLTLAALRDALLPKLLGGELTAGAAVEDGDGHHHDAEAFFQDRQRT